MSDIPKSRKRRSKAAGKKIVLTTFGSLGDLHPYIAIAAELKSRGHRPVIATSEYYRARVELAGIEFHSCRPDLDPNADTQEIARRAMDPKTGPEYVVRAMVLPSLQKSYADLSLIAADADLLVSHPLSFAVPLFAEKNRQRWVASVLAPMSFLSAYDLPVITDAPYLWKLGTRSPRIAKMAIGMGKRITESWFKPVRDFRADLGLPPGEHPLFEGQYSPHLNLALFSSLFAEAQTDWPARTTTTGFCFYDRDESGPASPGIKEFLDSGPAPIVFTLGSAAVMAPGDFYRVSAAVAKLINRRAILLIGRDPANRPAFRLPENVVAFEYAPYSEVFPFASVIVHQGGIGTIGQVLRSGRPSLVVPFSHDQPDNGARITRLKVGAVVPRAEYQVDRAAAEIKMLIKNVKYAQQAGAVSWTIQEENGAETACDALENLL